MGKTCRQADERTFFPYLKNVSDQILRVSWRVTSFHSGVTFFLHKTMCGSKQISTEKQAFLSSSLRRQGEKLNWCLLEKEQAPVGNGDCLVKWSEQMSSDVHGLTCRRWVSFLHV